MYKKCTWNSCIYKKHVQTVQKLYKIHTKNGFKLEMYVLIDTNNLQTIQNVYN